MYNQLVFNYVNEFEHSQKYVFKLNISKREKNDKFNIDWNREVAVEGEDLSVGREVETVEVEVAVVHLETPEGVVDASRLVVVGEVVVEIVQIAEVEVHRWMKEVVVVEIDLEVVRLRPNEQ